MTPTRPVTYQRAFQPAALASESVVCPSGINNFALGERASGGSIDN